MPRRPPPARRKVPALGALSFRTRSDTRRASRRPTRRTFPRTPSAAAPRSGGPETQHRLHPAPRPGRRRPHPRELMRNCSLGEHKHPFGFALDRALPQRSPIGSGDARGRTRVPRQRDGKVPLGGHFPAERGRVRVGDERARPAPGSSDPAWAEPGLLDAARGGATPPLGGSVVGTCTSGVAIVRSVRRGSGPTGIGASPTVARGDTAASTRTHHCA